MNNNLENEIREELEKEKILNFYNKNKKKIIFFIIFIILFIFGYQFQSLYQKKNNSEDIEKILLSKIYLDNKNQKGIDLLNEVKKSNNHNIMIISYYELIEFFLNNNKSQDAFDQILLLKKKLKNNKKALELLSIKETIIKFDNIEENEILNLLKSVKNENFLKIKNKLLYDFYIKNNQLDKASQFLIK